MWGRFKPILSRTMLAGDGIDADSALWGRLREYRNFGFVFKRQAQFETYILDFVEHSVRLVIDVENGKTLDADARKMRNDVLREAGYRVMRLKSEDVVADLDGTAAFILAELLNKQPKMSRKDSETSKS